MLGGFLLPFGYFGLNVGLVFIQRVEFGNVLDKFVVHLRQLGALDLVQHNLEHRFLAGQLLGAVILGEGDGYVERLAGLVPDELLLKARDEAARAELERELFALAALEGDAVKKPSKSMTVSSPSAAG